MAGIIPTFLEYITSRGSKKRGMTPEEEYLLSLSQKGQSADALAGSEGSVANQLLQRRKMLEGAGQMQEEDVLPPEAVGGLPAQTTVRGTQSASQQEQLIKLLMGRGMTREEAIRRARGM